MSHASGHVQYVLITPARNEERFIEKTIQSVTSQTVLPSKWVIVNDGSTDSTVTIVGRYLAQHDWMELVDLPTHRDRTTSPVVANFFAASASRKLGGISQTGPEGSTGLRSPLPA